MYPNKEQAEAYKYFMNALPKREIKWFAYVVKTVVAFFYLSPLVFFVGAFWLEWSKEKVSSMTYGFTSCILFLIIVVSIFTALENMVKQSNSDKWLELKENTLKDIAYLKEPKGFLVSFFSTKSLLLFLVVYAISVNTTINYAGWYAFFAISLRCLVIKGNNAEIAIIGQALIENRFKPKKIGLIKK